jgi:hypothetical protein
VFLGVLIGQIVVTPEYLRKSVKAKAVFLIIAYLMLLGVTPELTVVILEYPRQSVKKETVFLMIAYPMLIGASSRARVH